MTDHPAIRVDCEYCGSHENERCTDDEFIPLESQVHAIRLADYKGHIQYEESVWMVHTDYYLRHGIKDGDYLVGHPHWYDKDRISLTGWVDADKEPPSCTLRASDVYWVGWYDDPQKV